MKYKIINLVTEDYNKSIVFYNAKDDYIKKMYDCLITNIDIPSEDINKVFRIDRATIDFNSEYDMFLEDNIINILEANI
jgi:hypothetical protein